MASLLEEISKISRPISSPSGISADPELDQFMVSWKDFALADRI